MRQFEMIIDLENEAFQGSNEREELLCVLGELIRDFALSEEKSGVCMDINGNKVGSWAIKEDDDQVLTIRG